MSNAQLERNAHDAVVDLAVLVARLDRSMSSYTAELRGMTVNHVLGTELATIDASGAWTRDWAVAFAAVAVVNHGAGALVLTSDPPQSAAPSGGPGAHPIGAGAGAVINITGRSITLYGAPGSVVGLQVFTRPQPPSFGQVAANTTTRTAETSTLLLAGATRNGATQATAGHSRFRAFASSDVAGTLNVQQSRDGATWYTTFTEAVGAGSASGTVVESIVALPYVRAQYVNGATNQGAFELDTTLLAV